MTFASTKFATVLICAATLVSLPASVRAGGREEAAPKEGRSDRSAKVLRSLDSMREQLGKARAQIERLEKEIQGLREELAGTRDAREDEPLPVPPSPPPAVEDVNGSYPPTLPSAGGTAGDDEKTPKVFAVRDPNFGGGENAAVGAPPTPYGVLPPPTGGVGSEYLLVVPPEGDKVVAFETRSRRSIPFTVSNEKTARHQVTPVVAQSVVGLAIRGPKITSSPSSRTGTLETCRPGTRSNSGSRWTWRFPSSTTSAPSITRLAAASTRTAAWWSAGTSWNCPRGACRNGGTTAPPASPSHTTAIFIRLSTPPANGQTSTRGQSSIRGRARSGDEGREPGSRYGTPRNASQRPCPIPGGRGSCRAGSIPREHRRLGRSLALPKSCNTI